MGASTRVTKLLHKQQAVLHIIQRQPPKVKSQEADNQEG